MAQLARMEIRKQFSELLNWKEHFFTLSCWNNSAKDDLHKLGKTWKRGSWLKEDIFTFFLFFKKMKKTFIFHFWSCFKEISAKAGLNSNSLAFVYYGVWKELSEKPRSNGVLVCALACCAGGLGLIPAVGKSSVQYSAVFLPCQHNLVEKKLSHTQKFAWCGVSMQFQ